MPVTVITHHALRDDEAAREWDATMYDPFRETRERLDGLQARPSETTWYEVIEQRHTP